MIFMDFSRTNLFMSQKSQRSNRIQKTYQKISATLDVYKNFIKKFQHSNDFIKSRDSFRNLNIQIRSISVKNWFGNVSKNVQNEHKHQRFASRINVQIQRSLSFFSKDETHTVHRECIQSLSFFSKDEVHTVHREYIKKRKLYSFTSSSSNNNIRTSYSNV